MKHGFAARGAGMCHALAFCLTIAMCLTAFGTVPVCVNAEGEGEPTVEAGVSADNPILLGIDEGENAVLPLTIKNTYEEADNETIEIPEAVPTYFCVKTSGLYSFSATGTNMSLLVYQGALVQAESEETEGGTTEGESIYNDTKYYIGELNLDNDSALLYFQAGVVYNARLTWSQNPESSQNPEAGTTNATLVTVPITTLTGSDTGIAWSDGQWYAYTPTSTGEYFFDVKDQNGESYGPTEWYYINNSKEPAFLSRKHINEEDDNDNIFTADRTYYFQVECGKETTAINVDIVEAGKLSAMTVTLKHSTSTAFSLLYPTKCTLDTVWVNKEAKSETNNGVDTNIYGLDFSCVIEDLDGVTYPSGVPLPAGVYHIYFKQGEMTSNVEELTVTDNTNLDWVSWNKTETIAYVEGETDLIKAYEYVVPTGGTGTYTFTTGYEAVVYEKDAAGVRKLDYDVDDKGDAGYMYTLTLKEDKTYYFAFVIEDSGTITFATDVSVITAPHEHSYKEEVTTPATCTKEGVKTFTCSCGDSYTEPIPKTSHTFTESITTPATCTAEGVKTFTCACGYNYIEKIPANGHSFGEWTITKEATAVEEGEETRTCAACGEKEIKVIAKLTPTMKLNATKITLKYKQSTTAVTVTGLAKGDSVKSWKSDNTKIVTVTNKGKITAKSKAGTATITVTLASGLSKTITVKVQKADVKCTSLKLNKTKLTLKKGKTFTLIVTLKPLTCSQKLTFKSSDKKIATVSAKGKIKAIKKGTATITVKCGKKKATCKVTVK